MTPRIIIGISGASGFQYGVKALELLRPLAIEVHLVVSKGAEKTCELETDYRLDEVMALADVYDALVSKRVYKQSISHEDALVVIREGSGKHFDPALVEVFLSIASQIHAVWQGLQ